MYKTVTPNTFGFVPKTKWFLSQFREKKSIGPQLTKNSNLFKNQGNKKSISIQGASLQFNKLLRVGASMRQFNDQQ